MLDINVLLFIKGRLILVDLGSAKILGIEEKIKKTFTIIGTPHYMAPEVLNGKGYSYFCDLWSIGICMYEFLSGCLPYGDDLNDPYEIYT